VRQQLSSDCTLVEWSFDPEVSIWPSGCQSSDQTAPLSLWAFSIAPTWVSLSASQKMIEPSCPPLANRFSWIGCHARLVTVLLWPRKTARRQQPQRKAREREREREWAS